VKVVGMSADGCQLASNFHLQPPLSVIQRTDVILFFYVLLKIWALNHFFHHGSFFTKLLLVNLNSSIDLMFE